MPAISSKITLSSAAQAANTVIADIDLIKGGTYAVANTSSLESINSNYLTDGQVMFVADAAVFYKLTITPANPPISFVTTYAWSQVVLGAGSAISSSAQISALGFINADDTGSFLTSADTSSFVLSSQTGSFILVSQTSSMSVATASYIDPTFISASAAASGFGAGGSTPSGTISGSQQITDLGFINETQTGSMSVATASYALYAISASYEIITELSSSHAVQADSASFISDTFISASAARSGFGVGGGTTDISALNTFTGSIQTQVDSLTNATSSYLTANDTSSFVLTNQTSSMSVATASYIDPTFISASAAASGFGSGGGSVGTLQQVTDQGNTTNVSMSIMGLEIFSNNSGENLFFGGEVVGNVSTKGDRNTVIGMSASYGGNPFGSWLVQDNTIIGANAMSNVWKSTRTTILGASAFTNFRSGSDNTIIGKSAATFIVTGSRNVAIGTDSGFGGQSGTTNNSIWIGYRAVNYGDNTVTIGNGEITDNYFSGNLTGSIDDVFISEWGSISASLASLSINTGSFISSADTASFILVSQTSSMSVATASYIDPTFISASAAAAGFGSGGGGSTPAGTISGSQQIADLGYINQTQTSSMSVLSASYAVTTSYATTLEIGSEISGPGFSISEAGILTLTATTDTGSLGPGSMWYDGTDFYFNV
jgi:hypothetical protein